MDWLLLTKRPQNIEKMKPSFWNEIKDRIWLGATAENQENLDRAYSYLSRQDSAIIFLSMEPLLSSVDLHRGGWSVLKDMKPPKGKMRRGFDWVIAGGESGPNARPSNPEWFVSIQMDCEAAGVAFLFKQWGEWVPEENLPEEVSISTYTADLKAGKTYRFIGNPMRRVGKKRAGRVLDGKTYDGFPTAKVA